MSSASIVDTKRVCSHCLRRQHDHCTAPGTCACPTCNPDEATLPALPDGLAWEDPPPVRRGGAGVLKPDVERILRDCPRHWLRLHQYASKSGASSAVKSVGAGKWPGIDPKEWELVARVNDRGSQLYVRFVGKSAAE